MRKYLNFMALFLVIGLFFGCSTEITEEEQSLRDFRAAVHEVYLKVGSQLYYCTETAPDAFNRITGPNEIAGVCLDYAMEFVYFWNEVYNYDAKFGKAYYADSGFPDWDFLILDMTFLPKDTFDFPRVNQPMPSNARIRNGNFEFDSVYRDGSASLFYHGKHVTHFGHDMAMMGHAWPVIEFNSIWYTTDPTWFDGNRSGLSYIPHEIQF